jgi:uncharacterized protein YifN (PemK superfamily)
MNKCEADLVSTIARRRLLQHRLTGNGSGNHWIPVYSSKNLDHIAKRSHIAAEALKYYRRGDPIIVYPDGTVRRVG